jgi:hypothetical protein
MSELHVFTNDTDTVVARDVEDAWAVWCEHSGERRRDYEQCGMCWERLDPDKSLTIWNDGADFLGCGCRSALTKYEALVAQRQALLDKLPEVARRQLVAALRVDRPKTHPNGHLRGCPVGATTRTCADWASSEGRGFLCSTEW